MDHIIYKPEFNPELTGRAVYFEGLDVENRPHKGTFLVSNSTTDEISLLNHKDEAFEVSLDAFEPDGQGIVHSTLKVLQQGR